MKKLFLIRHGPTTANAQKLYYGAADVPLSPEGRALCLERRGEIHLPPGIRFGTTGMLRTEETLALMFDNPPHDVWPELREMSMGEFELRGYDELKDRPAFQSWLNDETGSFVIPGGESNRSFAERIQRCLSRLAVLPEESLLIVCHGGSICRAMLLLFPEAGKNFFDWRPQPCYGYAVDFEDGKPVGWTAV